MSPRTLSPPRILIESTPSSGSEAPAPLLPDTPPPHAENSWVRSRRVQTFALGGLVGALALSLLVVITSIFAAAQSAPSPLPMDPAPASGVTPMPAATPRTTTPAAVPAPEPTPTVPVTEEETDAATDDVTSEPSVDPAPDPVVTEPARAEAEPDSPGRSGSAPGHTKDPGRP